LVSNSVGAKKRTAKKLPVAKVQANDSKAVVLPALKRATKGKTGLAGRIAKAKASIKAKTSKGTKPGATSLATSSNVSRKTASSQTKPNQNRPIKQDNLKRPLPIQTAPSGGLPNSVRRAMEYLEQNPASSLKKADQRARATKKKSASEKKPR